MTRSIAFKSLFPWGLILIGISVLFFAFAGVYSFALPVALLLYLVYKHFGDDFLLFSSVFLLLGFSGDVGDQLRTILNLLAFGFAGWLMIKHHLNSDLKQIAFPNVLTVFFLIVLFSMVLSTVTSGFNAEGAGHTIRQFMFFVLLFFIYNLMHDLRAVQKLLDFVILIAAYVALTILYSFFSNITSVEKLITEVMVKEGGLFSNVAGPGALIAVALISMNYRFLNGGGVLLENKYLNASLTLILVLGLLLTNSRGAILCAGVGTIIFQLVLNRKRFIRFVLWGTVISSVLFYIFNEIFDILNLFFRTERVFENTRYILWDLTWNMIEKNYLFGTGPGVPKLTWTRYTNVIFDTWTGDQVMWVFEKGGLGHSHNFLLFRWAELGLLGLLTSVWLYIFFPYYGFKVLKSFMIERAELLPMAALVLAIVLGMFIRSVFEATGILSHGWISRDLPLWLFLLILFRIAGSFEGNKNTPENRRNLSEF